MRRLMLSLAALALLAGACGDDDDAAPTTSSVVTSPTSEGTSTSTTTSTSSTTSTSTTTDADEADGVKLEQSCQSPDGFTISYPADWEAVSDCGQFGPAPLEEPAPATDERTGVVMAFIDAVPFEQVSQPTEGDTAREETTIAGQPAVRVEGEQSGAGLYPQGTSYVRWLVDLSEVRGDATLFLDAYGLGYDIDFGEAVQVLDDMAQTVEITDG